MYDVDRFNGIAEFGVTILVRERPGLGLGFETHLALLTYGFDVLRLQKMYVHVKSDNPSAIWTCERFGMIREGTLWSHRWKSGAFLDLLVYGLLRAELDPGLLDWRAVTDPATAFEQSDEIRLVCGVVDNRCLDACGWGC